MSRCGIERSALGVLLIVLAVAGCSGDEIEPSAEAIVENHFATPEALIAEIRAALTAFPMDHMAFFDMCYAENADQERLLRAERQIRESGQIVDEAMVEVYGELDFRVDDPFPAWPVDEMRVVENDGQRAVAICSDRPRTELRRGRQDYRLHLLRTGDRWWVSGYSWEYLDEFRPLDPQWDAARAQAARRSNERAAAHAARIRAGDFDSAEEAREAWLRSLSTPDGE